MNNSSLAPQFKCSVRGGCAETSPDFSSTPNGLIVFQTDSISWSLVLILSKGCDRGFIGSMIPSLSSAQRVLPELPAPNVCMPGPSAGDVTGLDGKHNLTQVSDWAVLHAA